MCDGVEGESHSIRLIRVNCETCVVDSIHFLTYVRTVHNYIVYIQMYVRDDVLYPCVNNLLYILYSKKNWRESYLTKLVLKIQSGGLILAI